MTETPGQAMASGGRQHRKESPGGIFAPNGEGTSTAPVTFKLPLPPSANNAFPTNKQGRRFKSEAYQRWLDHADMQLRNIHIEPLGHGPYRCWIAADIDRRSDISNRGKLVEDFLVKRGITPDDRWDDDYRCMRVKGIERGWCQVTVQSL